jgi:hypothetical protein
LEDSWGVFGLFAFFLSILVLVPESLQQEVMNELKTFAFEDDVLSSSSIFSTRSAEETEVLVPMCVCLCHGLRELPCFAIKGKCQHYLNHVSKAIATMNIIDGLMSTLLGVIVVISFFLSLVSESKAADCFQPLFASHRSMSSSQRAAHDLLLMCPFQQQETAVLLTEIGLADVDPLLVEEQQQAQRVLPAIPEQ